MDSYDLFKSPIIEIYGREVNVSEIASWAIWAPPANDNWSSKDSVGDMTVFDDEYSLSLLKSNYIFVGLNPANHGANKGLNDGQDSPEETTTEEKIKSVAWSHFHSNCKKKSQDYKLRKVFYREGDNNEGYEFFKGSLIIDLNPNIVETNSREVMKRTSDFEWEKRIADLLMIRKELGGYSVVVPMGQYAYDVLCKYREKHLNDADYPDDLIIRGIRHFSAPGYKKFSKAIGRLSKDALDVLSPCFYKGEEN